MNDEKTRYHMQTTGFFSKYLDKKYGFGFSDLEKMSMRRQRDIITQRAKMFNKEVKLKNKFDHRVVVIAGGDGSAQLVDSRNSVSGSKYQTVSSPPMAPDTI